MIPQNLLLAFLSLQAQDQGRSGAPQSSQLGLNVFDSVSNTPESYQVKEFHDFEPTNVETHDQQSLVSNEQRKIHRFPFEKFAVGHYDDRGLHYHGKESGHVHITTNTTSHLWSLAESFPFINPKHDSKNIKGAYPNFAGIKIIFEKKWQEVHVTLAYLSPDGFVKGKFSAQRLVNGKFTHEDLFIEEKWTTWIGKPKGELDEGIDNIGFYLGTSPLASHEGYRFVVESVTWS